MSLQLRVDHREPSMLKSLLLAVGAFDCVFENLTAGDFEFVQDGVSKMIIERKEINDLCASINDGRFDDQKKKLSATASAQPRPIVYVIEGHYDDTHMMAAAINTVVLTTRFRDGFFVVRTEDIPSTHQLLARIGDLFQRGKLNAIDTEEQHHRFIASRSAHRAGGGLSRKNDWWQLALTQIDGVGPKAAKAIVTAYPTAQYLIEAYSLCNTDDERTEVLAKISSGGRKLGPKVAKRIWETVLGVEEKSSNEKQPPKRQSVKHRSATGCLFTDKDNDNEDE